MLLLDAFDLTYEMASMTEESIEEHTINGMDIMVDHFMNQQLPKHFFIQIGYSSNRNSGSDLQRSEPEFRGVQQAVLQQRIADVYFLL